MLQSSITCKLFGSWLILDQVPSHGAKTRFFAHQQEAHLLINALLLTAAHDDFSNIFLKVHMGKITCEKLEY